MAVGPIVARTILRRGKEVEVYRRGNRFVSAAAYRAQQWRMAGGKAGTVAKAARRRQREQALRAQWGAPPAGKNWIQIAKKYPERFIDYVDVDDV